MPLYDYFCKECQEVFEQFHQHMDDEQEKCPVCGAKSDKIDHLKRQNVVGNFNSTPLPKAKRKFGDKRSMPHKSNRWL